MTRVTPFRHALVARQRGIVLAVSLILLAVIGLSSVTALKSGLFGGLVASNMRSNELAVQAAEMALRFCERQVMADPPAIAIQPLPLVATDQPVLWADINTWVLGLAFTLPDVVVNSPRSDIRYVQAPQCLVESMELRRTRGSFDEAAFVITARGFSPEYRADANGAISGSQVWLQSTIRYTP